MLYNTYTPEFAHLLSLTEKLVSIADQSRRKSRTSAPSFEEGIIVPLSLIIMKCGHLPLRQQALRLLRQAPKREGMWNRDNVLLAAELKVVIEKRGRVVEGP